MLVRRTQFLRAIGHSTCCARPRSSPKSYDYSYQFNAYQSTNRGQHEAPRSKKTFRDGLRRYFWISVIAQAVIIASYELRRDYGVFDSIASCTIFRVVPPKRVESPNAIDSTIYQPFTGDKEIRLLVIEPGDPGDELKCHLINAQLCWRTRYEALSCTWGDATITRSLSCSGRSINVTLSLHDALSDLRRPRRKRLLWVDAVCINQADNDEKAKQVRLMGEIYSQAWQVLIYLGKSDPSVDGAMESIRWLDRRLIPIYLTGYKPHSTLLKIHPITEDEINLDPIINLLRRPWFRRTWVIQEAILAKRAQVICGDQSISWAMFERVVFGMNKSRTLIREL